MSCSATRERLSAYVDGELPQEQAAAVGEHLASCATCARDYEAVLNTVKTLREGLVRYRAPDVLGARVRAGLREERVETARVLRGENPASIPFYRVKTTKLMVNPAGAGKAGVSVPPEVVKQADTVVGAKKE